MNKKQINNEEIRIPYKNHFLKQITNGKYGSKTYNTLVSRRRQNVSKPDKLFINKNYPTSNENIEKFNLPVKKEINSNIDFATEINNGNKNIKKSESTNTEAIMEKMDENTNQFIDESGKEIPKKANSSSDIEMLKKQFEKMSTDIEKLKHTQKIIIKVINKLSNGQKNQNNK